MKDFPVDTSRCLDGDPTCSKYESVYKDFLSKEENERRARLLRRVLRGVTESSEHLGKDAREEARRRGRSAADDTSDTDRSSDASPSPRRDDRTKRQRAQDRRQTRDVTTDEKRKKLKKKKSREAPSDESKCDLGWPGCDSLPARDAFDVEKIFAERRKRASEQARLHEKVETENTFKFLELKKEQLLRKYKDRFFLRRTPEEESESDAPPSSTPPPPPNSTHPPSSALASTTRLPSPSRPWDPWSSSPSSSGRSNDFEFPSYFLSFTSSSFPSSSPTIFFHPISHSVAEWDWIREREWEQEWWSKMKVGGDTMRTRNF